jgi:hypothetical protein
MVAQPRRNDKSIDVRVDFLSKDFQNVMRLLPGDRQGD